MSLCDCGEQLARMLRREGRHSEAADILKRLLVDLGEPLPDDDFDRHIHLKQELSLALVRCMFQTGAFGSLSRAPQLCCCCATGSLAAGWGLEESGSLRNFAPFTQSSHMISRNSSSSRATTATLPAGHS